jgi:hypothetical protein
LSFNQTKLLNEYSIRGLVFQLQQSENILALKFYRLGVANEIYPVQVFPALNSSIVIRSDFSPFEMKVICNEALKQILEVITEGKIYFFSR